MKKILFKFLIICVAMCSALCVFTACSESPISFKVNFIVDEEIVKTIDTAGNEKIALPENPTKDGYDFDGWFWDKDTWENPFTANSLLDAPLSSDMSVYAKFKSNHIHHYSETITKEPTCTEKGEKTFACECGYSYTEEINTLEHTSKSAVEENRVEPRCTEKGGYDLVVYCSVCNAELSREHKEIAELGHKPINAVEENRIEPKCNVKGGYDLVVYCSVCNAELSREHKETEALQHEFTDYVSDDNATYDSDGTKTAHCNHGCGATNKITDVGTKLQSGIAFKTLTVDGNNVYGKIPNAQTEFDFLTEIEKKGNVSFNVSKNLAGDDIIVSKTAEPIIGDNKYYILVYQNGELLSRYNVTIRRREIYDVTFNSNGGTVVEPQRIEEDSLATEPTTTRADYTFMGWDYDFNEPIMGNTKVNAQWSYFTLTTSVNDTNAGEVTKHSATKITAGNSVTITATTNIGYTWLGWYNGEEKLTSELSYTFDMPSENICYTARWCYFTLTTTRNDISAGSVSEHNATKITIGNSVTLTATTNTGYTFIGWYNGDKELTKELSYTFAMPSENITYTAEWTYYTLTTIVSDTNAGSVSSYNKTKVTAGNSVTITATTNIGYTWLGWYNGDQELSKALSYTFNMSSANITYTAKWEVWTELVNFNFISTATTCTLTGIKDRTVIECSIPDSITSIGYGAFRGCSSLTSITIPDSVTSIEYRAFWGCSSLTSITIPDSITSIGDRVFYDCSSLTSITIPDSVTSISNSSFYGCSSLTTINIDIDNIIYKSIDGNLYSKDGEILVLFAPGKIATEFFIPNSVTSIGNGAFYNCSSLTSVTIPDSVTSIGNYAFEGCSSLTSISIPNSVMSIGWDAFYNCRSLTSITIPDSVTSIGGSAFWGCSSLTNIIIPNSVWKIGDYAFSGCNGLTSVIVPDSVTSIGKGAFQSCSNLTSVTLCCNVKKLEGMFSHCSSLTNIIIPNSVWQIGTWAFSNCSSLTSVTIPDSVTSISSEAFINCDSLTSINYSGTKAQWQKIHTTTGSRYKVPAGCIVHCYDGDI